MKKIRIYKDIYLYILKKKNYIKNFGYGNLSEVS